MKICYEPASQAKASVLMSNKRNLRHLYFLLLFYFVFSSVFTRISAFMDWIRANARKNYPDRSNVTRSLDLSGYAYGLNQLERYEDALKQVNLSLAANPNNTHALEQKLAAEEGKINQMHRRATELYLKGKEHFSNNEFDKALECYEQALANTPSDPDDPLVRSHFLGYQSFALNKLGRYVEAIERAGQALALDSNNQFAKQRKLAAEKSLKSAHKVVEYFTKGNESYARNDFNKAIYYYKLALDNCRYDRKCESTFYAFQAMSFNKLANHPDAYMRANDALILDSTNELAKEQKNIANLRF